MTQRELNQVCRMISYGILAKKSRAEIAEDLNRSGIKPPKAERWTEKGVSNYRYENGLPTPRHERDWKKEVDNVSAAHLTVESVAEAIQEEQLELAPIHAEVGKHEPKKIELQGETKELENNNDTKRDMTDVLFIIQQIVQLKSVSPFRKQLAINALTFQEPKRFESPRPLRVTCP